MLFTLLHLPSTHMEEIRFESGPESGSTSGLRILSPSVDPDVEVQVHERSSVFCRPIERVNLKETTSHSSFPLRFNTMNKKVLNRRPHHAPHTPVPIPLHDFWQNNRDTNINSHTNVSSRTLNFQFSRKLNLFWSESEALTMFVSMFHLKRNRNRRVEEEEEEEEEDEGEEEEEEEEDEEGEEEEEEEDEEEGEEEEEDEEEEEEEDEEEEEEEDEEDEEEEESSGHLR